MKIMNMVNAINDALDIKLTEDKNVIVYGKMSVLRRSIQGY